MTDHSPRRRAALALLARRRAAAARGVGGADAERSRQGPRHQPDGVPRQAPPGPAPASREARRATPDDSSGPSRRGGNMKRDPLIRLRNANPVPVVPALDGTELFELIVAEVPESRVARRTRPAVRRRAIAVVLVSALAAVLRPAAVAGP